MPDKQFRTRKQWLNTIAVLAISPFLLLGLLVFALPARDLSLIAIGLGLSGVWLAVAMVRDRSDRCIYFLEGGHLVLRDRMGRLELPGRDILDASLVERATCKDYLRRRIGTRITKTGEQLDDAIRACIRFSTVDVGLNPRSIGVGRFISDRFFNSRFDLVLLRLKNGEELLLSPEYNQDLIGHIGRIKLSVGEEPRS